MADIHPDHIIAALARSADTPEEMHALREVTEARDLPNLVEILGQVVAHLRN